MREHERKYPRDDAFEALLAQSVAELPPEEIVADVTPWRQAMERVLFGLALCMVILNLWCLNYILPAIGTVLLLLGFRTLRQENPWLRGGFVCAVLRAACVFPSLILNTTILPSDACKSAAAAVSAALMLALLLCFWQGLCAVRRKAGLPAQGGGAGALLAWYVLMCVLAAVHYMGWIVPIAMLVGYVCILRSLFRLSRALDEAGYAITPQPVRVTDRCIALVLAAAAGYVSASAAHRLSRRHGAFYLLGLVPWIPALLMPAACVRGLAAWVSGLIARWNVLHDGSAQLLNTAPDFVDEKAAAFVGAMLIAQAAHFVVVHRYRVLGAVLGGFWIALGLADGCFSPLGAALMLAGMLALYVSDISLHLTRAAWRTLGILLALLAAAAFLPDMDMQGIRGLREKAQCGLHELRYGADSLPGGVLAQADTLHSDTRGMLSVTEGQEKTLYLRGYIGGMYADGAWKPLPGLL
mgnify:CR=1 FL=1